MNAHQLYESSYISFTVTIMKGGPDRSPNVLKPNIDNPNSTPINMYAHQRGNRLVYTIRLCMKVSRCQTCNMRFRHEK